MRRFLLAAIVSMVVGDAVAETLNLPGRPTASAVVTITGGPSTIELRIPADYPLDSAPWFGFSGDLDEGLAVIGAPEAWSDGVAFLYDATTGEHLHTLTAGQPLDGGTARARFGSTVDLADGLVAVTAPLAGAFDFGPGVAVIFDAQSGARLQTIWGPGDFNYVGGATLGPGYVDIDLVSYDDGSITPWRVALIPEPMSLWLVALGLLAATRNR